MAIKTRLQESLNRYQGWELNKKYLQHLKDWFLGHDRVSLVSLQIINLTEYKH